MKYLILGGLGFIGQQLAKQIIDRGDQALIVDNLSPQVHRWGLDEYIGTEIKICDYSEYWQYLDLLFDCDHIVHLASETGTGQSMYEIERYIEQNIHKFGKLLNYLLKNTPQNIKSISLSSSRSIYGEGAYFCSNHGRVYPSQRSIEAMLAKDYEPHCPYCNSSVRVISTREDDKTNPLSIYATTKLTQELLLNNFAQMSTIQVNTFRFQNVYGEGQSLSNPYTGILAIFSNLARAEADIKIFEDGCESRDFVHVYDVCRSMLSVIDNAKNGCLLNIGSGSGTSVLEVAEAIKSHFGSNSKIIVTHQFRKGDIRHNIADLTNLNHFVDTSNFIKFSDGLYRFLTWAETRQQGSTDAFSKSLDELSENGLLVQK